MMADGSVPPARATTVAAAPKMRVGLARVLVTLLALSIAAGVGWGAWNAYMAAPWTRDGTVMAYVVTVAPEVAGRIVRLPLTDNDYVRKGDLLMAIDTADYAAAVAQAEANLQQAQLNAANAQRKSERRNLLTTLEASQEEQQTFATTAATATAAVRAATAALAAARVNLERTEIRSPVNGYVTNLLTQQGDFAVIGQPALTLVNADSFWVNGYFEETEMPEIEVGDLAVVKLMGAHALIHGHVQSISRGIGVANVQPDHGGLATVNPIFTWVRLAQRIPVHIQLDQIPAHTRLVVGETASVEIEQPDGPGKAGATEPAGR